MTLIWRLFRVLRLFIYLFLLRIQNQIQKCNLNKKEIAKKNNPVYKAWEKREKLLVVYAQSNYPQHPAIAEYLEEQKKKEAADLEKKKQEEAKKEQQRAEEKKKKEEAASFCATALSAAWQRSTRSTSEITFCVAFINSS